MPEIVVGGNEGTVAAYDLVAGRLQVKWEASTCSGGQCPEARGMAAADLDGDGKVEVVVTTTNTSPTGSQVFMFDASGKVFRGWPRYNASDASFNGAGNHGYGALSARRHKGFVKLPVSRKPTVRASGDWYPPSGIPAPTVVDIAGDRRPEIVAAVPDGFVYAVSPDGRMLWSYDYAHRAPKTFASEVVAADLNRDGRPELVFGTYALAPGSGRLIVLSPAGKTLYDIRLPRQGRDGNGIGVPAAPSIGDVDGDGRLEIVLSSFDHGIDVFRVPGSDAKCLPWPTGRGNLLRNGTAP